MPISPLRAVVELAHYLASNGSAQFGGIHMAVTEGRARDYAAVGSTSCGDLLHTVLFAAGCREPFINRDEHEGWRSGENLYLFIPPWAGERIWRPQEDELELGDLGCYDYSNSRAHGFIYLGRDDMGNAITSDFGQPGGRIYHCGFSQPRFSGVLHLRGRPLEALIRLNDKLRFSAPAETVGGWCARKGLPVEPWHPLEHFGGL